MARTYRRRDDEIEEFSDDALHMQEADAGVSVFHIEEDEGETLELGDRGRKGFGRLSEEEMFRNRDY